MKAYIHARLGEEERRALDELKRVGHKESDIIRRGLRLVAEQERRARKALEEDSLYRARPVGHSKDGKTAAGHDDVLYRR
jgi:hypothetical protein